MAFETKWGQPPELIVVDNLMDVAMDGHEEFSGMRSAMKELKYLARDTNACILVLHHTKEGFIGTPCQPRSAVQGMVNQIPALILTIGQEIIGDSTYLCVAPVKNRYGKADATGGSFVMLSFDPSTMQLKDVHTND
jgi:predicted ATP-dependent serine protease